MRAPPRALVLVGEQKHLHLRSGRDDRADVASLDHGVTTDGERALPLAHDLAHLRMPRHGGNEPVDLGVPDGDGHVLAVELDEPVLPERNGMGSGDAGERGAVGEIDPVAPRDPGQRAVHRPRVEVPEAETPCERRGDRALPRSGWTVDGHDHVAGG